MASGYGCWSQLTDDEKRACVVTRNPKRLDYRFGKTLLAHRAIGKVQEEWQSQVLPQLTARTSEDGFRYAISRGKPIPDSIVWTLYLVGETSDVDNLRPTIVAESAEKATAELGCKALKKLKSGLGVLLKNYDIHYRHNVIRLRTSDGGQSDEPKIDPPVSLCGAQALLESTPHDHSFKVSTIGGAIIVDGKYYALTTAHAFSAGDHAASIFSTKELNGIDDDGSDHSRTSSQSEDSLSDTTVKPRSRAKDPLTRMQSKVYVQECDPTLIDPINLSVKVHDVDDATLLNNKSSTVMLNRHEDWALIPIDNDKYRTANHYMSTEGQSLPVTGVADTMPSGAVTAATGVSCYAKTSFMFQSMILLPSSKRPRIGWVADMQTAPGDSGSWLIDEHGKACAMIVAASEEDNEVFCLPLVPIFESIRDSLKASAIPSTDIVAESSTAQSSAIDPQAHKPNGSSTASYRDERPHAKTSDAPLRTLEPQPSIPGEKQANPFPVLVPQPERDVESPHTNSDNLKGRWDSDDLSGDETGSDGSRHKSTLRPPLRRDKRRGSSSNAGITVPAETTERLRKEQNDKLIVFAPSPKKEELPEDPTFAERLTSSQRREREREIERTKEHHEVAETLARLAAHEGKERQAELERTKKKVEETPRFPYRTIERSRYNGRDRKVINVEGRVRAASPPPSPPSPLILDRYDDSRPSYMSNASTRMRQNVNSSSADPDFEIFKYKRKLRRHLSNLGYDTEYIDRIVDVDEPGVRTVERTRDYDRYAQSSRYYTQPQIASYSDWHRDPDRFDSSQIERAPPITVYNTATPTPLKFGTKYGTDEMDVLLLRKFGLNWTLDEDGKIVVRDGLSVLETQLLLDLSKDSGILTGAETVKPNNRYPRVGKTKMPKRLVHYKALVDLGYSFHEDDLTFVIEKALSPDEIDEVFAKSQEAFDKATEPSDKSQSGERSTTTKHIVKDSHVKGSQPISRSKNMLGSSSDATKKIAKSKLSAKTKAAESLSKATPSNKSSDTVPPAGTKELSRQSRPQSTFRHRKNTGPLQAEKHSSDNENHAPNQEIHANTQDLQGTGNRQDNVVAACQAEDLQYEADVQTLFWEQNLPVELCDQILQLHSEKEARFDAFWKSKSVDLPKHNVQSRASTQPRRDGTDVPVEDLRAGKKPTKPAGSSSRHRIRQPARLTKTNLERKEISSIENLVEDDSAQDVEDEVVVEEDGDNDDDDDDKKEVNVGLTEFEIGLDHPSERTKRSRMKRATVEFADEVL